MIELDLRWSLLLLGALVVVGVLAFNRLQERRFQRFAERSMPQPRDDVLMDEALASRRPAAPPLEDDVQVDVRPVHAAAPAGPPARRAAEPADAVPAWLPDVAQAGLPAAAQARLPETGIDFPALITARHPLPQSAIDALEALVAGMVRPVQLCVLDEGRDEWLALPEDAGGRFRAVGARLLLADRQGVASAHDMDEFARQLEAFAARAGAQLAIPDAQSFEARAAELQALIRDVDMDFVFNVAARTGQVFQGATIRALAEGAGMHLRPDGRFLAEDARGNAQFTLDNQASEPFFADTLRALTTPGITFLLDVPRAAGGLSAFDRMVLVVRRFAESLDGLIVDDRRRGLDDSGIDAIRRTLATVCARMEAAGIPPGSALAQRLFR